MKYKSTRSQTQKTFCETVMEGLAKDGGLYVPTSIPQFSVNEFKDLSYNQMAFKIFREFISSTEINDQELSDLIDKSYSSFRLNQVVKNVKVGDFYILELFHGPTFAFKDVALQFLGNLFDFILKKFHQSKRLLVLGATSGDTGGAAIYGLRGKDNIDCVILHPKGRISPIQQAQMTTILDKNVYNIAVEQATFDDCQELVKKSFNDKDFNQKVNLGAINSINWARIMAQITYYFYSYFNIMKDQNSEQDSVPTFIVPTGNFGDILAGFYAKKMGLPIKLVIATNQNDILNRFFKTGVYEKSRAIQTFAPAMDIQVSSNFERFLYHLVDETKFDVAGSQSIETFVVIQEWMTQLQLSGKFSVKQHSVFGDQIYKNAQKYFSSGFATDLDICKATYSINQQYKYVLDPHTACAVHVLNQLKQKNEVYICLATAHPVKFLNAVAIGLNGVEDNPVYLKTDTQKLNNEELGWLSDKYQNAPFEIPPDFIGIMTKERREFTLKSDLKNLQEFLIKISEKQI